MRRTRNFTWVTTLLVLSLAGCGGSPSSNTTGPQPPSTATPQLVQVIGLPSNQGVASASPNDFYVYFDKTPGAGNLLGMFLAYATSSGTVSITDDHSNSWSAVTLSPNPCAGSEGATAKTYALWIAPNAAASTSKVTVTFSSTATQVNFIPFEFTNVATSSPVDGTPTCTLGVTGPSVQGTSQTTSTSGDLIVQAAWFDGDGNFGDNNNVTGITFDSGFTGMYGNTYLATGAQYEQQATAGAINPTLTISQSKNDTFASITVAFKTASAGVAPSGMYVKRRMTTAVNRTPMPFVFPCDSGNLIVAVQPEQCSLSGNTCYSGITDSNSNTYTLYDGSSSYTTSIYPQFAVAPNATCSNSLNGSISSSNQGEGLLTFLEIAGAATSPIDTSVSCPGPSSLYSNNQCENSGTQSGTSNVSDAPDITPSTSSGLTIAVMQFGIGPPSGITLPSASVFGFAWYNGSTDPSPAQDGNGWGYYWPSSTSEESWEWTAADPGNSSWSALAMHFKADSAAPAAARHGVW